MRRIDTKSIGDIRLVFQKLLEMVENQIMSDSHCFVAASSLISGVNTIET
jgi:hypothetical protein